MLFPNSENKLIALVYPNFVNGITYIVFSMGPAAQWKLYLVSNLHGFFFSPLGQLPSSDPQVFPASLSLGVLPF